MRPLGGILDDGGDLVERSRGLFEGGRLLLGALRQVVAGIASSLVLPFIASVVSRTSRIVACSVSKVLLTFCCSSAKAPWKLPFIVWVRSPSARLAMTRRVSPIPASTLDSSVLMLPANWLRLSSS